MRGSRGRGGTTGRKHPRGQNRSFPPAGGYEGTEAMPASPGGTARPPSVFFPSLRELGEDAEGRLRVEEPDLHPVEPGAGRFVDQADPLSLRMRERRRRVVYPEAEVVDPFPVLLEELPDRPVGRRRLEHLDRALPHSEDRRADLLLGHLLDPEERKPQDVTVEGDGGGKASDRPPDVLDLPDHVEPPRENGGATPVIIAEKPGSVPPKENVGAEQSRVSLRRLGGGLRSWLAERCTCTAALPSCGCRAPPRGPQG